MFLVQTALWMVQISWLIFCLYIMIGDIQRKDYDSFRTGLLIFSIGSAIIQLIMFIVSK